MNDILETMTDDAYMASLIRCQETCLRIVEARNKGIWYRRNRQEMTDLYTVLYGILERDNPQTVRGTFYQAVVNHIIEKSENDGQNVIGRNLVAMRRKEMLPFAWIADNTRWMRKPTTYTGLEDIMYSAWKLYRRDVWQNQPVYIEIWVEKDALAGLLYEETEKYDVPLLAARGFSSLTFLYTSAVNINEIGKKTYIYYFGDMDLAGRDIERNIEKDLRHFTDVELHFERVAVTMDQINDLQLPSRPEKGKGKRAKQHGKKSYELDSIPAWKLRELAKERIERHISQETLHGIKMTEEAERQSLKEILDYFNAEN